jgi:hypothetical protein
MNGIPEGKHVFRARYAIEFGRQQLDELRHFGHRLKRDGVTVNVDVLPRSVCHFLTMMIFQELRHDAVVIACLELVHHSGCALDGNAAVVTIRLESKLCDFFLGRDMGN